MHTLENCLFFSVHLCSSGYIFFFFALWVYVCLCALKALCAAWLAGWVRFCSFWSVGQICKEAAAFPRKRSVLADKNTACCAIATFSPWKRNTTVRSQKFERGQNDLLAAIAWSQTQFFFPLCVLWDLLIPWQCMFIRHNHGYKQENVPLRECSRNTGGL